MRYMILESGLLPTVCIALKSFIFFLQKIRQLRIALTAKHSGLGSADGVSISFRVPGALTAASEHCFPWTAPTKVSK